MFTDQPFSPITDRPACRAAVTTQRENRDRNGQVSYIKYSNSGSTACTLTEDWYYSSLTKSQAREWVELDLEKKNSQTASHIIGRGAMFFFHFFWAQTRLYLTFRSVIFVQSFPKQTKLWDQNPPPRILQAQTWAKNETQSLAGAHVSHCTCSLLQGRGSCNIWPHHCHITCREPTESTVSVTNVTIHGLLCCKTYW